MAVKFNKKIFGDLISPNFPENRFYIYKGGRGSGKSHAIAIGLLNYIEKQAGKGKQVRILCTREIQNSIKDSVHKLLRDYIGLYNLAFTITEKSITYENGSEFIFKGLNDINDSSAQSIKSLEGVDIAWIEEAQTISKRSLDVLIPTIRKENSCLIFSYNPLTNNDPVKIELADNPRPRTLIKHVNYTDNPYLDKQQIEEAEFCRINKPEDYAHIWLGEPKDQKFNSVVKYFTDDNIHSLKYIDFAPLHISCDFNVDPMSWVIAHKDEKNVYFIDEIVIEGTNVQDTAKEFLNRYPAHKSSIIINGDASGDNRDAGSNNTKFVQLRNELYKFGYKDVQIKIKKANPRIHNRVDAFNQMIFTNNGERCILIDPKCKWLVYNCKNLNFKTGTSVIDTPTQTVLKNTPESKFLGHIYDAASYIVEYYFPIKSDILKNNIKKPKDIWEKYAS